jgi:transposase-like protein
MAEGKSMTVEQVARQVLAGEHADVLRESVRLVCQELMELEVSELIGASHGERTPDRATHRNGYRRREWDTRAGVIELEIPKLRRGSYFPHGLLEPRKRGEQALLSVRAAGVRVRGLDPARGPAGREPGAARLALGGVEDLRAARRAGRGLPPAAA